MHHPGSLREPPLLIGGGECGRYSTVASPVIVAS